MGFGEGEGEEKIWEARLRRRAWAPDMVVVEVMVMRMEEARMEGWADRVQGKALLLWKVPASYRYVIYVLDVWTLTQTAKNPGRSMRRVEGKMAAPPFRDGGMLALIQCQRSYCFKAGN